MSMEGEVPEADGKVNAAAPFQSCARMIAAARLIPAEYRNPMESPMAIERTLSIIKPDAVAKNVIGQIYTRFENAELVRREEMAG